MKTSQVVKDQKGLIPRLDGNYDLKKGDCGRVGVLGGCFQYTGAPYYAGISALYAGADLVHIFCTEKAGTAIKSYSPELIVHPCVIDEAEAIKSSADLTNLEVVTKPTLTYLEKWIGRLTCLVVGPGLGRDAVVLYIAEKAISLAKANSIPIVVDADGLFLVSQKPGIVIGYKNAILTPNVTEYRYLCKSVGADESESVIDIAKRFGGLTIFQKGKIDRISNGTEYYEGTDEGCPRRCGGQGDVLSGTISAFVSVLRNCAFASCFASALIRKAAFEAVQKMKREKKSFHSMCTEDIIERIGFAFHELFEDEY